jgi:hypothetical protein
MSIAIAPLPAAERGSALGRLALTELKLFARERLRLIFGVGLPLLLVIIIGCIPFFNQPRAAYGGATFLDIYVPIMVAFSAALLSLTALPMMLAGYRERGVLRRLQTTPIGPARVLAAQLLANLAVVVGTSIAILLLARIGFGVAFPRQLAGFRVDEFRRVGQVVVAGAYRPGDGRDQVVDALDRLDVAAGLAGLDRFAEVGQGHLDHVAEGLLREIGHPDAHQAGAGAEPDPQMIRAVSQVSWYIGHCSSYMSSTMSALGRAQQMSTSPAAGSSSGSGA